MKHIMGKKLGSFLVLIVAAGLMIYSMSRTFHLLSATLPPGQEILAAIALLGFDLGLVAWLVTFLKSAEGAGQRAIAALMIIVNLIAVVIGFMGDTLLTAGQSGLLEAMDMGSRQTIVMITAAAIACNIAATIFYHMADPANLRRMTEESARDKITSQALAAISQQANLLAEELAPVIAADWVRSMRADFSAALVEPRDDVKRLPAAQPSRLDTIKARLSASTTPAAVAPVMVEMASDSPTTIEPEAVEVAAQPVKKGSKKSGGASIGGM
jgi:hypothetical protein